jgi:WD40 repeat protein
LPADPRCLNYSPDGKLLALICAAGQVLLLDTATGAVRRELQSGPGKPRRDNNWVNNGKVRFSPDGRLLFTWGTDSSTLWAWESASGQLRYSIPQEGYSQNGVEFSPDGKLLAMSGPDRVVRVYEIATGRPVGEPLPHPDETFAARFNPDGRSLVTACADGMARLFDWRTGRLVCPPFEHRQHVIDCVCTPDSRWVVTASIDGTARVWETRTGRALTPPLSLSGTGQQPTLAMNLCLSNDGRRVAVGNLGVSLVVFNLDDLYSQTELDPAETRTWSELLANQRIQGGSQVVNLTSAEWLERWRAFRGRHPDHDR